MINTLAALLAALTAGTIILMVMETAPIRPRVKSLIAALADPLEVVRHTSAPRRRAHWRNIVIHATGPEGAGIADRCHFVVDAAPGPDGVRFRATDLWKYQQHSRHVTGPNVGFNGTSVGVCLVGDFSRGPVDMTAPQLQDLAALVRSLQFEFRVSPGHVYLLRDLDSRTLSPGRAFPVREFYAHLLKPAPH